MTETLGRAREMLAEAFRDETPNSEVAKALLEGHDGIINSRIAINAIAKALTREPSEADVERVADAMQDDPFADDIPLSGTTQQRLRCEHYARAAIAAMAPGSGGMGEGENER